MKVNFMHLCDYATVSRENKLSILGIFGRINAATFPWPHPTLYFVCELETGHAERDREFAMRIECIDQDGQKLLQATMPLKTKPGGEAWEVQLHHQLIALHGFQFPRPGTYEFVVSCDALPELGRLRFEVAQAKAPEA